MIMETKTLGVKELYKLYQQHPCITTDSRNCPEGSIFLALKGERLDGNQYALQALEKGCSYAIVSEELRVKTGESLNKRIIRVADTLQTLKDMAREHRRQFDLPMVAITGTNGKTTTKELVAAVLATQYDVLYTQGNFNNDVGVPKTLFRLTEDHDIAVIEMGASHPGDIKTLVETAEPTCGLITNVGRAHLQGFGSFEGVCRTKGELYDYLASHDLPVFVNRDNEHLVRMITQRPTLNTQHPKANTQHPKANTQAPDIYYYGQSDAEDILIRGELIACDPYLRFRWREQDHEAGYIGEWMEVKTHLIGAYNLDNMLAAIIVGYVNNIPFEDINRALSQYVPTNNRSQLTITQHNHLVVDAYNANPTSMKAAIENFRLIDTTLPKMAILGQMGELGELSHEEHSRILKQLEAAAFDRVWLVGEEWRMVNSQFSTLNSQFFETTEDVKTAIAKEHPEGYYILIKGSNSNRLFELPDLL